MDRGQNGDMQNPSDLPTRATLKTTRFSVRDAKSNAAGVMHRASMGAIELQRNCPEMQKTLGTSFVSRKWKVEQSFGQDRNRTFQCFPNVFEEFERCFFAKQGD